MKKLFIALIILILLALGGYYAVTLFYNFSKAPKESKVVYIPKKSSLTRAAQILEKDGIIPSAARFKILASITGKASGIKPGKSGL